jgi:hypothetical protein
VRKALQYWTSALGKSPKKIVAVTFWEVDIFSFPWNNLYVRAGMALLCRPQLSFFPSRKVSITVTEWRVLPIAPLTGPIRASRKKEEDIGVIAL